MGAREAACTGDSAHAIGATAERPTLHRRGADIARFARLDDIMQSFEGLLERRVMVQPLDLIEVDIIHAEPTRAVIDLGEYRLARQPGPIGAGTHPAIDL